MQPSIFVNYRREDSRHAAGRLRQILLRYFSPSRVFFDIDSIEPGKKFLDVIESHLNPNSVLLVIIGRHWLGLLEERNLGDSLDYVKLEIIKANDKGMRIVPLIVEEAFSSLREEELPRNLRFLCSLQQHELRHHAFDRDAADLARKIGGHPWWHIGRILGA